MSAAANPLRVILTLINGACISAVTFSFPFKQILHFSLNTVTSFAKPVLLWNVAQQPHVATHVFSLTALISIDAAEHKLISEAVIPAEGSSAAGEGSVGYTMGL